MNASALPDLPLALSQGDMARALKLDLASIDKLAPGAEATIAVAHIVGLAEFADGASAETLRYAMASTLNGQTGYLSSSALMRIFGGTFYSLQLARATFPSLAPQQRQRYLRREITQLLEPLAKSEDMPPHELVWKLATGKRSLLTGRSAQARYHLQGGGVTAWLDQRNIPYIQIAYRSGKVRECTFWLPPAG